MIQNNTSISLTHTHENGLPRWTSDSVMQSKTQETLSPPQPIASQYYAQQEELAVRHQPSSYSQHLSSAEHRTYQESQSVMVPSEVATVPKISDVKEAQSLTHGQSSSTAYGGTIPVPTRIRTVADFPQDSDKIQPKSSLSPTNSTIYIQECEAAAAASRLPPSNMSMLEIAVMRQHLSHLQITTYVVTRNAILRLWVKNPLLWVTIEEAQGVAREERHFLLCRQIWEFLLRHGYINYGCLTIPETPRYNREEKEILIIGAGIAGLATARQLESLLATFHTRLKYNYKITLLEARTRIGGRVYSHKLKGTKEHPSSRVDLGAQIVTGFAGGNPMSTLLKRQLACPDHSLSKAKNNKIYGLNGITVNAKEDSRVEGLFNLLLDVASNFRPVPLGQVHRPDNDTSQPAETRPIVTSLPGTDQTPNLNQIAEQPGASSLLESLDELRRLGYEVRGSPDIPSIEASDTLGSTMSKILKAYLQIVDIDENDRRILDWHWANMEYACGTNLKNLSLSHWDQDDGNEFRGHHAMVIGGYSQVARGLALAPSKLRIRTNTVVKVIQQQGVILEKNDEYLSASKIVVTVPLGVLKAGTIKFSPELPDWKLTSINKLGFGLLNKIVLVYDRQFWDAEIDLIGTFPLACTPSLDNELDRGRFYMFWNCTSHAQGRPVLIALMAGDAAYSCEQAFDSVLIHEATCILQRIHPKIVVPEPTEHIITRWGQDPYSLGSYSYIGSHGSGLDYETLAKPIHDHWFFAGEATCRTHPSTVHGAYLSGLAAAGQVLDSIIGEQEISNDIPLVPIKARPSSSSLADTELKKRKLDDINETAESRDNQAQKHHKDGSNHDLVRLIQEKIGPRPEMPKKMNANPFLIFQKDQWNACRLKADEIQQAKQKNPMVKASKNQIRACLGQTWRETSEAEKQFWVNIVNERKLEHDTLKGEWEAKSKEWDQQYAELSSQFYGAPSTKTSEVAATPLDARAANMEGPQG